MNETFLRLHNEHHEHNQLRILMLSTHKRNERQEYNHEMKWCCVSPIRSCFICVSVIGARGSRGGPKDALEPPCNWTAARAPVRSGWP